ATTEMYTLSLHDALPISAALSRRLCVHAACDHRPSPHRSDHARGPVHAPVPVSQRCLPSASGEGRRQAGGGDGRFAPAPGGGSLDTVRGYHATLTADGERCRPDARLIRGETIQRKNFFAKTS